MYLGHSVPRMLPLGFHLAPHLKNTLRVINNLALRAMVITENSLFTENDQSCLLVLGNSCHQCLQVIIY